MNAVLETSIFYSKNNLKEIFFEFNEIIRCITLSNSKQSCIDNLNNSFEKEPIFFKIGFSSNHLWIHQIINGVVSEKRLIFTLFE
jgi:hypothetical protein